MGEIPRRKLSIDLVADERFCRVMVFSFVQFLFSPIQSRNHEATVARFPIKHGRMRSGVAWTRREAIASPIRRL
jgi:hypothetical protein